MAKWGEGDPRWIVEERPDATNVNNWHWTEKNATPWSKDRLKMLFENFKIVGKDMECTITDIKTLDGEATANNRKGKLIFFYEWNIVLNWSGHLKKPNSSKTCIDHKGQATIPNLSEENDLDEIEITITIDEFNTESDQLKEFMYKIGRNQIRKQIGVYLNELKLEYSKGLILPKKDNNDQDKDMVKPDHVSCFKSGFNKETVASSKINNQKDNNHETGQHKIDVQTLKLKIKFQCRCHEIYDVLTKPEMVSAFTRGEAKLEAARGGEFLLFGGNVHGKFQELIPNKKIIQTWRLKQWPAGHFSHVVIEIEEKNDHTELTLTQTGVPSAEADTTSNNWERYYWNSIKQTFGFGSFLV